MKELLLCAVLAAAAPACAQVVFDASEFAGVQARAKSLRERLAPAAVDPKPVKTLFDRLAKDGEQIESESGMMDAYRRTGAFDAVGRLRNLSVGVVELPDPADSDDAPMARRAVYRRLFSHVEAKNEDVVIKKDGTGRVDVWEWVLSLDGRLMSVTHAIVPLGPSAPGVIAPVEEKIRAYRMSPSDPAVQRRWNRVVKELLTLGRTIEA